MAGRSQPLAAADSSTALAGPSVRILHFRLCTVATSSSSFLPWATVALDQGGRTKLEKNEEKTDTVA